MGTRPLLVTGRGFAHRSGLLSAVENHLVSAGLKPVIFERVEPDPAVSTVEAAAELGRTNHCDLVIGIGGGSAMDAAKAAAVLLTNPSPLDRYFGSEKPHHPPAPVVCIPTTAGTASEVTQYAVIIDPQTQTKKTLASESIIPRLALLNPQWTVSLPADLTAATGMDAFSHALEAFLSTAGNGLSDAFCLQSLEMIIQALPAVLTDLQNLDLRRRMLLASTLAGLALNSAGTIINHGMAYTLTIRYGTGHGLANALLLPYTIAYIADDYPEKIARLCQLLGCEDVEVGLLNFNSRLNIPTGLTEAGLDQGDISLLADACVANCQRALPRIKRKMTVKDYAEILRRAF